MQFGASEFEHTGSTDVWVGPANLNSAIPGAIQQDMSEALAMTLTTGQVDCKVSPNIRQQQYERMIGFVSYPVLQTSMHTNTHRPIAFHPTSILFEISSHAELLEKVGVRDLISDVIDELLQVASIHQCSFPADFKQKTIQAMLRPTPDPSTMYQDFTARRPMEVETYLGAPMNLAADAGVKVPRIQTLYAMLHNINITNKDRPLSVSPTSAQPTLRTEPGPPPQQRPMNGFGRGRPPPGMGMPMAPPQRRGPPPVNGFRGQPNGYPRGPNPMQRRPSLEENAFDEFQHVILYDDIPEGDVPAEPEGANGRAGPNHLDMRERELVLRERELRLRQAEAAVRRGAGGRRTTQARRHDFDEDDDDDEYFDPTDSRGPPPPQIDPDNFDMMSVTSRRTRRAPSANQLRKDVFEGGNGMRPASFGRPHMGRNRASARIAPDVAGLHDNIMDNPMMSFSSNRYGAVDRKELHDESRANSLTAGRLQEMSHNGGPYPPPPGRRMSQSPGNPFGPAGRGVGRPSPPHDGYPQARPQPNGGRPSPPGMRAPVAKYPPGHGNSVHPQQVEQQIGVSKPFPPPKAPSKSLTGSASASAGSGDSGSANIDSEPSAHSSTSSLGPRHALGVR